MENIPPLNILYNELNVDKHFLLHSEKYNELQKELYQKFMACKNDVLENVAEMVLGRKPEKEDAGNFQLVKYSGSDIEIVSYKGVRLGVLKERKDASTKFPFLPNIIGWEFIPDKEYM